MVASEPVGPEDELPQYLPTEIEAGSAPRRVYIRRTSKCGSTTSRSGCIAADAQVEANRQAREEAGDAPQGEELRAVRGVALDTRTGVEERTWSEWAGRSGVARQIDA